MPEEKKREGANEASPVGDSEDKGIRAAIHRKPAEQEKRLSRGRLAGILAVAAIAVVCLGAFAVTKPPVITEPETLAVSDVTEVPSTDQEQAQNPIAFDALRARNSDIYAWLYVPGTAVSVPILQSETADNFYLYHNIDREPDPVGASYTQSQNNKSFTDPVTVIYGHTFQPDDERADEAFGTLHAFEDEAFSDEHPYFYIYTPQKMYTYQIVSAAEYDNRHILNTHDFSDPAVLQSYLDLVVDPEEADAKVGDIQELEAGAAYIVQLSTCTRPSVSERRYIVTGVMVGEHNYETITSITKG